MNRLSILSFTLASIAVLPAAERPLGAVATIDDKRMTVSFDASVQLPMGSVVAIYGPGRVEKHPLTKDIIIEERKLIAKAQIIGQDGTTYTTRVAWSEPGSTLAAGYDAIPLPGEAAPNSPPTAGTAPVIAAGASAAVTIKLPISDPDGDTMWFSWSLDGVAGQTGRLSARTTTLPELTWYAPGVAATATLKVTARDSVGQLVTTEIPLQGKGTEEDLRNRAVQRLGVIGAAQNLMMIERDASGGWWGFDKNEAAIVGVTSGWLGAQSLKVSKEAAPGSVEAIVPTSNFVYVLDGANRLVQVYKPDGGLSRQISGMTRPTDLAIDAQGTLFVADQSGGGVLVFESNGRFRARLGQQGKGNDAFTGLTKIALGPSGEIYCLDAEQRLIQRFDRFQRRLDSWDVQGDVKVPAIDIAWHPRGLLLLMGNGQIQIFNKAGLAKESMPPASQSGLGVELEEPSALTCDAGGEVYATYGTAGVIARYSPEGKVTGLRGALCSAPCTIFRQDASGRTYALDGSKQQLRLFDSEGFLVGKSGSIGAEIIDLAVSPDGKMLCALDADKLIVNLINPLNLAEKPQPIGGKGISNGQWKEPIKLTVDEAGRIYVLDAGLHRVVILDKEGKFLFNVGHYERGKIADELVDPRLLAVSPSGDALYVSDYDRYDVKKFALDFKAQTGTHVTSAGGKGDNPGQIRKLAGLGCDRLGLIYLLDAGREDVQVLDFRGSNAVALYSWSLEKLSLRRADHFTVLTDGGFMAGPAGSSGLMGGGTGGSATIYRW